MRIGPVDLTTPSVVYAGAIVGVVIVLLGMWQGNKSARTEGYYSPIIQRGMRDDGAEVRALATEACQTLLASHPEKNAARLSLATMQLSDGKFKEAQKTYEDAASRAGSAEEKAWAYVGAGVAAFRGAEKDSAKAIGEAQPFFEKALSANSDSGDAAANLALLEALKGAQGSASTAERYVEQALNAKQPPSLPVQQQLLYMHGMMLARNGRIADALDQLDRAMAMQPKWKEPLEGRRLMMLASVFQKDLTPPARKEALERAERELFNQTPKVQITYLNALGLGYSMFKGQPDYPTIGFDRAQKMFKRATESDGKDTRGYFNLAALYEDRVQELAKQLTSPVTGINGETPVAGPWNPEPPKMPPADQTILSQIKILLREQLANWQRFAERSAATPEEKAAGFLRYLATLRRMSWLGENETERKLMLDKALSVGKELIALSAASGDAYFSYGHVLFDKGDMAGALEAFQRAKTKGLQSAQLEQMLNLLSKTAEAVDIRPGPTRRSFGTVPLLGATLRGLSAGVPKSATMQLDGKIVAPVLAGTQIFYLPTGGDLSDGRHTVNVTVIDAKDTKIEVPEFTFHLDKKAPVVMISPESTETLSTQPVWTVKLLDGSGVDYATLRVQLKAVAGGLNVDLVRDGKYAVTAAAIKVKSGDVIKTESFQAAPSGAVPAGDYVLTIEARDVAGNKASEMKIYRVK